MSKTKVFPSAEPQEILDEVHVRLADLREMPRVQSLLRRHHYLGCLRPVGERLVYIAADQRGRWVGADLLRRRQAPAVSGPMDRLDRRATAAALGAGGQ